MNQIDQKENFNSTVKSQQAGARPAKWICFWTDMDAKYLFLVFFLSLAVRLFVLHEPSVVVFDEVHFGGFASNYLNGNYYLDVHPPLAKMLVALTGWLGGLDPNFRFEMIGVDYIDVGAPYIFMRFVPAILGTLMVPMAYIILRSIGSSPRGALWTSLLVLFENAFVTQFRLILLDAYLAFGIAAAFTFYSLFREPGQTQFSKPWWTWLILTGVALGFTVSSKMVGLFTIATIGVLSVIEMWHMLSNAQISMARYTCHFLSRIMCFLLIPALLYLAAFYAHFKLLQNIGLHGTEMSTAFQQDLRGADNAPTCEDVGLWGDIVLRHHSLHECFLHSHAHTYPTGSKQQQVTLYSNKDENNHWRILPAWYTAQRDGNATKSTPFIPVRHGDIVRLEHIATGTFLHSHPVEPSVSHKDHHFEVSCYGSSTQGVGDTNDHWRIEITDASGTSLYYTGAKTEPDGYPVSEALYHAVKQEADGTIVPVAMAEEQNVPRHYKPRIRARRTLVRLIHVNTGCYLTSFGKKLPEWGFGQLETTCGRDTLRSKSVWIIDQNENPFLEEDTRKVTYKRLSFWGKFAELQTTMWQRNEALTADHYFGSKPSSWFTLSRGLGFWNGMMAHQRNMTIVESTVPEEDRDSRERTVIRKTIWQHGSYIEDEKLKEKNQGRQIYLLGNPITWWFVALMVLLYSFVLIFSILADQRSISFLSLDSPLRILFKGNGPVGLLFAWALHYFPFFLMGRQLFLHHYLPAYYFGILLAGYLVDYVVHQMLARSTDHRKSRQILCYSGLIASIIVVLYVFVIFSPLSYGLAMSREHCLSIRWLQGWDFDCDSLISKTPPMATL